MRPIKTSHKLTLGALALSCALMGQAQAAERIDLNQPATLSAGKSIDIQQLFVKGTDAKYRSVVSLKDHKGTERTKYQQYYDGIPVYGATVVASSTPSGQKANLYGEYIDQIGMDLQSTKANLDANEALQIALNSGPQSLVKNQVKRVESSLQVWLDPDNKAHLSWFINYIDSTSNTPSRPYFIIDAIDGRVLHQWEGMTFAKGTGAGGNQRTGRYQFGSGGSFDAFDVTQNGNTCSLDSTNVVTYDMQNQTSGGSIYSFNCYENVEQEVNGGYGTLNDAHAFGQTVYNMYKDWYGFGPITQKLKLRVHYDRNYENAYWDGQQMTFGDGANTFHPLVSYGVVGHEVSHGFTQQHSNLAYEKQSGGLNESFSDMAAAAVSYYLTGSFSWQIGDRIRKGSGAMRYMDSPTRDGRSIDNAASYSDSLDVHLTSGVYNKAFYLLSTSQGWNIRKAFDTYLRANQLYWRSTATFVSAGQGVYSAAKDLGYCVDDVVDSLAGVGINGVGSKTGEGCGGGGGNTAPVANFSYSANGLTVAFTDTSTDDKGITSHSWTFGDGSQSTSANPSHSYAADGSYTVNLTVTDAEGLSNSYSSSVTVSNGGGGGGSCDGIAAWDASTSYALGDLVAYNGNRYEAIWWSTGAAPDIYTQVWKLLGACSGGGGGGGSNQAPTAGFSYSASALSVSFTDTSTDDNGVTSYQWNFGDGVSSSQQNPTHSYNNTGSYTVQLTVTDADNASDTTSQTITVSDGGGGGGSCTAPAWNASTVYLQGDKVSQGGNEYQANWWTQGQSPSDNSGPWAVWTLLGGC